MATEEESERIIFVLTHEASDGSSFHICGVTSSRLTAQAWYTAGNSDGANVYPCTLDAPPVSWIGAGSGWRGQDAEAEAIQEEAERAGET